jgi:hypothetical protein
VDTFSKPTTGMISLFLPVMAAVPLACDAACQGCMHCDGGFWCVVAAGSEDDDHHDHTALVTMQNGPSEAHAATGSAPPSSSPPPPLASPPSCRSRLARMLPRATVAVLKNWLLSPEHVRFPYPTEAEKEKLAADAGLTTHQVAMWFTNARRRSWRRHVASIADVQVDAPRRPNAPKCVPPPAPMSASLDSVAMPPSLKRESVTSVKRGRPDSASQRSEMEQELEAITARRRELEETLAVVLEWEASVRAALATPPA